MRPLLLLCIAASSTSAAEVDFAKQVLPILTKTCIDCHKAPYKDNAGKLINPKGGLRLDGASFLLKGGTDGVAVEPGNPDNSGIYSRIILPSGHDDAMPPKGKGDPLEFAETEIIKQWIVEGAKFGDWKGAEGGAPGTPNRSGAKKTADPLAAGVAEAPAEAMTAIRKMGALVSPVALDSKLLRVEWISSPSLISDKEAAHLKALASNITELDLSDTAITDETLNLIATFTRLTRLNLSNTAITDGGVSHLRPLVHLESLNLHSTGVSDASLNGLAQLRKLRQVFFWKTRISGEAALRLQKAVPGLTVSFE